MKKSATFLLTFLLFTFCFSLNSKAQTALNFDGTDDYVDLGTQLSTDISGATAVTLEAWVKTNTTTGLQGVINNYVSGSYPLLLRIDNNQPVFYINSGTSINSNTNLTVGKWYHLAGVWDGSTLYIYIDGVLANSASYTAASVESSSNLFQIGRSTNNEFMNGNIDKVRIWNTARTVGEISTYKDSCISPSSTGLVALYTMENTIGTSTLVDETGNGYNGTLTNMDPATDWVAGLGCTTPCTPSNSTTSTISVSACDSYTVPSGDETHSSNGTYMDTILNAFGCDSIITINLTINNATTPVISPSSPPSICQGDSVMLSVSNSEPGANYCFYKGPGPLEDWQNVGSAGFSAGEVHYTRLAIDGKGTPYVVYTDYGNGQKATVMKYDGSSWVAVGSPGFSPGAVTYTSIAIDGSGTPYVAFEDHANGFRATVMKFDGISWITVGSPGFSMGDADYSSIAIDDTGTPFVAYKDAANIGKATVMKYNGNNNSWVTVGTPGFSDVAQYTSLALDSAGTPYVAYKDAGNGNKATVMKFDGSSWVTIGTAGFSAGEISYSSLALDGSGTPYVVYTDYGNNFKATVMKYNGTSWISVGTAGFSANSANRPSLVLDANDTPYVAYRDGGTLKAMVMRYTGSSWVTVGNAGFSAGVASYTSLAIDDTGTPYVAYRDGGNIDKTTVMRFPVCAGTSNTFAVQIPGSYELMITDSNGCNATSTSVAVDISSSTYSTINPVSCISYTVPSGDEIYTSSGTYSDTVPNAAGCDSIIMINLTIFGAIVDQAVSLSPTASCDSANVVASLSTSETGVTYYLRDHADSSYIDTVAGTGSSISFNADKIYADKTYNVYAEIAMTGTDNAADLSATNDYVKFDNPYEAYSKEITVEAWVYTASGEFPWAGQSTFGVDNQSENVWLWHGGTLYVNDNGTWRSLAFPALPNGWTHVSTVADTTGLYIYYNGTLVDSASSAAIVNNITANSSSALLLGQSPRYPSDPSRNSDVAFDNFRIWNTARTETEIAGNMNNCLTGSEAGLVQYNKFDEGSGFVINSETGSNASLFNGSNYWITGSGACVPTDTTYCFLQMSSTPTANINYSNTGTDIQVACDSYTWINGVTYTSSNNTAMDTLTNAAGCDSVVTLDLTINYNTTGTDVQTACDSYTWIDGITYTSSNNTATDTISSAAGCDSVVTLDLTINYSTTGTDVQTACDSYTWIDGVTYTSSNNTATDTLSNAAGCDSVVTLDLTIDTVDTTVVNSSPTLSANTSGANYQWLDCDQGYTAIVGETSQSYTATANGTYAVALTDNGCTDTSSCYSVTGIGIESHALLNNFIVYPNPTHNDITIQFEKEVADIRVTVLDVLGREVQRISQASGSLVEVDMPAEPGVYFMRINTGQEVISKRVVVN